jgi:Family of unknown function (DUF5908)
MPVEIKELVIRAVVNEGVSTVSKTNDSLSAVDKKILKVVNKLAKQLKKNER